MKRLFPILLIGVLVLVFPACENYLDEELTADVSAGSYYTTESGLEDAVRATYETLRRFWAQEIGGTMTVFGTDTYTNGADGSWKGFNTYDTQLNPSYGYVAQLWRDMYYGINQANAVLNRSQDIDMDPDLKARRRAEAHFLRAYFYFTLVRQYGDVHLTLNETEGIQVESERVPAGQVYEAIIADLDTAMMDLPLPADQPDYGRPHKAAVEFLLGKVYVTRAYQPYGNGDSDFQLAATHMENVINNYDFELLDHWGSLWDMDNQLNSEVIWAIQNTSNILLNGDFGNRFHLYFLMEYDKLRGMQRDTENGRPWKRFKPTEFLLYLWDRDIDRRYDEGYKHVWYANYEASIPEDGSGNKLYGLGDTTVLIPGPGRYVDPESVDYLVINEEDYTEREFPSLNKFIDPTRPDRQHVQGQRDWVPMRLADAYLIAAEAYHGLGDNDKAAELINVVRRRAAWDGMEDEMEISASDVDIDFILDERARELVGEMHRWYDLTRTGKLIERVRLHNPQAAPFITENKHELRPIPQDQRDKTISDFPQNQGYAN